MKHMILSHLTIFTILSAVSWVVLKGFEALSGNAHENETIFLTTLIISFFIMFTGYSNGEGGDNE